MSLPTERRRTALTLHVRRFLRKPRVIVGEVVAISLAIALMTGIPQVSESTALDRHRFAADWPLLANVAEILAFDRVTQAPWFLALVLAALASLLLVLVEQWRVLLRTWRRPLTEAALLGSPFTAEFERPARQQAGVRLMQTGRIGLAGSAMLHLGLVLCVLAGFAGMLIVRSGVVELVEGETIAAGATEVWAQQWGGPLSQPLALQEPLQFQQLKDVRYPSGELQSLSAVLHVGAMPAARVVEVAVNTPLDIGAERLYLTAVGGAAVLVELGGRTGAPVAVLLRAVSADVMEYDGQLGGIELHLRAAISKTGKLPEQIFARILLDGGMRYAGPLAVDQGVNLSDGRHVVVRGVRHWSQFRARRDDSLVVAWVGLACGLLGSLLIYGISPVAWMVRVDSLGATERVVIRMKPLRFAPLFRERFAALVRAEGGAQNSVGGDS